MNGFKMNEMIGQGRTADIFKVDEYRVIKIFKKELSYLAEMEYERAKAIDGIEITAPDVHEILEIDGKKKYCLRLCSRGEYAFGYAKKSVRN